ncbi:MAG: pantetheine-phosphate adenylyltransferase [Schleiferiaceae bacterium]|jgi:pantetheine-phosphate adenylyltransferase|nr:pantetheine-phosphate adenylyltransferase [Schleiferiaceae bacterium]
MVKTAIFPGSFDPITLGHVNIVERALPLFDKIILAVGSNADKKYLFPLSKRVQWLENTFEKYPKIEVLKYDGLTIEFAKECNANFLLRGLRNPADFEFEKAIAQANRELEPQLDTVFFLTSAKLSFISSSLVRDVIINNGEYSKFVPEEVRIK